MPRPLALFMTVLLACGVAACKEEKPAALAAVGAVGAVADTMRGQEQAKAALMALPELQTWSAQIEQASKGAHHPALMEDGAQTVNGKRYWQLTFAEDSAEAVQRKETFLVAEQGGEILVRDFERDATLSLAQWRAARPAMR
jgi:hypothetical protein